MMFIKNFFKAMLCCVAACAAFIALFFGVGTYIEWQLPSAPPSSDHQLAMFIRGMLLIMVIFCALHAAFTSTDID
jgi:hypothetical protein